MDQVTNLRESRAHLLPQDRLTAIAADRHSQRVRLLRLLVPACGAALLATYALSATPPTVDLTFEENFRGMDAEDAAQSLRLNRPRYAGSDLSGLPFQVSANSATRTPEEEDIYDLDNPRALRTVEGSDDTTEEVTVTAERGQLDTKNKRVNLRDDVALQTALGGSPFVINTEAAQVDLETNVVRSQAAVRGEGDAGTVAADTATAYQSEDRVVLEGNVRIRLNRGADAPVAAEATNDRAAEDDDEPAEASAPQTPPPPGSL